MWTASEANAVSADGRFVAFYSDASNLVPGDTIRLTFTVEDNSGQPIPLDALSEAAAYLGLPRRWGLTQPQGAVGGAHAVAEGVGVAVPVVEWIANALAASVFGLVIGGVIVALMHLRPGRKSKAAECPPEIV